MKKLLLFCLFSFAVSTINAQNPATDSLKKLLSVAKEDTSKVSLLCQITRAYSYTNPDTALQYAQQAYAISLLTKQPKYEAMSLYSIGLVLSFSGNYPKALKLQLEALQIFEKLKDDYWIATVHNGLGITYREQGDLVKALEHFQKCKNIYLATDQESKLSVPLTNIGGIYGRMEQYDSAMVYELQAIELLRRFKYQTGLIVALKNLGNIHFKTGNLSASADYFHSCIREATIASDNRDLSEALIGLAQIFRKKNQNDSSIFYARQSLHTAQEADMPKYMLEASSFLADLYEQQNMRDSAFSYFKLSMATKDVLYNQEKDKQLQNLNFDEQLRQQELSIEKSRLENERRNNLQILFISLFIFSFLVFVFVASRWVSEQRTIETLGLIGLLISFEFINLLIHPFISNWTNHQPVLMLLILVAVAAVLIPTHHRLTTWVKKKVSERPQKGKAPRAQTSVSPY